MAQLDQIQISFVAAEDRLLLRMSTQSGEEFRFWLTRRFVKALRPGLSQTLSHQPRIQVQANTEAKQELLNFQHQQAVQASDFKTPYKNELKSLPLGEQPVTLTRFQVRPQPEGRVILTVGPEQGNGIDLALNPHLVHSLIALLNNALDRADWGLVDTTTAGDENRPAGGSATIN
jgi:hypothetical protein